jgi:hypothetical protein
MPRAGFESDLAGYGVRAPQISTQGFKKGISFFALRKNWRALCLALSCFLSGFPFGQRESDECHVG